MYRLLRWVITACVRHPRSVVAVTAVLFAAAVYGMTFVPKQFFPQSSRNELMVELRLPGGSSFTATEGEVAKLEAVLKDDPDIDHFTAYTGYGPAKVVRLKVDQDRECALGLSPQDVSATLQTLLTGVPVSQYREGLELIDVVARAVPEDRLMLETLPDLTVITPAGHAVPLS